MDEELVTELFGETMTLPWKFIVEWITPSEGVIRPIGKVYVSSSSKYQEYLITELADLGKSLILDGKVQSSVSDEFWYHEALVHPTMLSHPNPRRVLIIGGGEGATAREVLKHCSVKEVMMVDLDYEVVKSCREYFGELHQGSFYDPRFELIISDGRVFVESLSKLFDVIIVDVVDPIEGGPATALYTEEFYRALKRILASNGIFVTQAVSPSLYPRIHAIIRNTVTRVFRKVSSYITYVRSYNGLWGFVAGSDKYNPADLTKEEIEKRLSTRLCGKLKFYDSSTHQWMFNIPKPIRETLSRIKEYATDSNKATLQV